MSVLLHLSLSLNPTLNPKCLLNCTPDVDELHVGRPWQRVGDADEEGRQHQKRGDIHGCNGFKVGFLYIYRVEKILIGCALE